MNNIRCGRRILITGANRGLGFEMVKQLLQEYSPEKVFATCRNPDQASCLNSIAKSDNRVHVMQLDVSNVASFSQAVDEVNAATNGQGIHVLINNAGIFSSQNQGLEDVTTDLMWNFFQVNTFGPLFLTQAFRQLLITANANSNSSRNGLVVNFASKIGSISDNKSGGLYASRCSRSATNAMTKSMSIDLKNSNIIAVAMNPGWVKTDQGGDSAPLTTKDSVRGILKVLDALQVEESGLLMQYDGAKLEW